MVTDAIVMCVVISVYRTTCHQLRSHKPLASQSMAELTTAESVKNNFGSPWPREGAGSLVEP
jgi:hypothetical protein